MAKDIVPAKQVIIRDEEGKFVPGVSGNPNGRPKKGLTLTDIAKEILEEELPNGVTRKEALMRQVAKLAYDGNETMIKLLWNYIDGMPTQKTDLTTNGKDLPTPIIPINNVILPNNSDKEDMSADKEG